jgi:dephospho-CoA kinase
MMRVGLTGGIGSGKSLVSSIFAHLGVPVFHADGSGKSFLSEPKVTASISEHFGPTILTPDNTIDRKALADRIFNNPSDLEFLNRIIHPLVIGAFENWLQGHSSKRYILHEAAILFESGYYRLFDKIIAVHASRETCLKRVTERDKVDAEAVMLRMKHQWDPDKVAASADFVIDNEGDSALLPQVLMIHEQLLKLET